MKQLYNPAEDNLPKTNIKALYKMKHEKVIKYLKKIKYNRDFL